MKPECLLELQRLAQETNNATLHTLLDHWLCSPVSFEEWAHQAIVMLTKQNNAYLKVAVDAEMRANPKPIIMVTEPDIEDDVR